MTVCCAVWHKSSGPHAAAEHRAQSFPVEADSLLHAWAGDGESGGEGERGGEGSKERESARAREGEREREGERGRERERGRDLGSRPIANTYHEGTVKRTLKSQVTCLKSLKMK